MYKGKFLTLLLLCFCVLEISAQDISNFTQFFLNPYTLNPSYAGADGRTALSLTYRKQWSGIEGAPTIANFSFHAPLKAGVNIGVNATNDSRGLISNSGLLLTVGYTINLADGMFLRFGLSGGGAWNTFDMNKINDYPTLLSDPAFINALNQNSSIIGNAGISAHIKSFNVGVAMPRLFTPAFVSKDAFNFTEVNPMESLIIHASNRFYFANNRHMFEPFAVYRLNNGLPSQYEVAGVLHLNHTIWLGGSYKQDFGISALGGIKLNKLFAIGGSYTLSNSGINELNAPTFEVHLSLLTGNKKNKKKVNAEAAHGHIYSFIDTEIHKLSAKELAAEKKKQEEEAKKKHQEELAAKEAEKKKQEEAAAKHQAEEQKKQEQALAKQKAEEQKKQEELSAKQKAEEQRKQEEANRKVAEEKRIADEQAAKKIADEKRLAEAAVVTTVIAKETTKEKPKEPVKEPIKETPQEPVVTKEIPKETPKEVQKEIPKETIKTAPIETPKEDNGPERTYKYGGSNNPLELPVGNYVIVGAFGSRDNAINMAKGMVYIGFNANYGFLTEKNLWYVYVFNDPDINKTRTERDKYRKMTRYRDAWLLTIEK